jgi:hypothetical protein
LPVSSYEFILQSLPLISRSFLLTFTRTDIALVALDITLAVAWSPSSIYHSRRRPCLTSSSHCHRHYRSPFPPVTMPSTSTSRRQSLGHHSCCPPSLSLFRAFAYPIAFARSLSPLPIALKFEVPTAVICSCSPHTIMLAITPAAVALYKHTTILSSCHTGEDSHDLDLET